MSSAEPKVGITVEQVAIRRYRAIEFASFEPSKLTVLVGLNGSGKTSALYAISIALSRLTSRIASGRTGGPPIRREDIRNGSFAEITVSVRVNRRLYAAETLGYRNGKTRATEIETNAQAIDGVPIKHLADDYREEVKENAEASIPVVVFHTVSRMGASSSQLKPGKAPYDQTRAYDGAYETQRNFKEFFKWFREREDFENEQIRDHPGFRDRQLDAVRLAISSVMDGYTNLRIRRRPKLMMVLEKGTEVLAVNQLSDGERTYLALIGDLAMRLCIANPGLGDPLQGEGVALIDEIDLHLHPQWQRRAIEILPNVFPNVQFIVTTHSPIVAGSALAGSLFIFDSGEIKSIDAYGQDAARILDEIFDTPPRPNAISERLKKVSDWIDDGNADAARAEMRHLEEKLPSTDPELVRLRMRVRSLA